MISSRRSVGWLAGIVAELGEARLRREGEVSPDELYALGEALARATASADLSGRWAVEAAVSPAMSFAAVRLGYDPSGVIPNLWAEAVRDMRSREPMVARRLTEATEEVARIYGSYRDPVAHRRVYPHGFALARSADVVLTRKVRELVASGLLPGSKLAQLEARIAAIGGWSRGYAGTVLATNLATANAAGRFRQAQLLADRGTVIGFRFTTKHDDRVRQGRVEDRWEDHLAADGLVARHDDPVWEHYSPPGGHRCRCVLTPVASGLPERGAGLSLARELGISFAAGFGGRPDRVTYGAMAERARLGRV